jgi:predicted transcriptional regulator
MVLVMGIGGATPQQQDLFSDAEADAGLGAGVGADAEPVLMALHAEYYELIWQRLKTHEFRRRFLEGRPTRWFVYLNAPVSRLAAVIDLGPAVVDVPERIAAIAERAREGNGASVLEYVKDLERAFAIPILHVSEYPGLSAGIRG